MHQLNFATYASQIFWFMVSFGAFYAFVSMYFVPKINELMELKSDKITKNAESVSRMLAEIKEIDLNIERKIKEARDIIVEMRSAANSEVEGLKNELDLRFMQESKDMVSRAKLDIESEMNALYAESEDVSNVLVQKISDKVGFKMPIIESKSLN